MTTPLLLYTDEQIKQAQIEVARRLQNYAMLLFIQMHNGDIDNDTAESAFNAEVKQIIDEIGE